MVFGFLGGQGKKRKKKSGIQWVDKSISERVQIERCSGACGLWACPAYTVDLV